MTANQFLDTNILVYAFDSSDPAKQQMAKQLIAEAATSATGWLSTQALGEFFHATVIRRRLLTAAEAARAINAFLEAFVVAAIEPALVTEAFFRSPRPGFAGRGLGGLLTTPRNGLVAAHARLRYWDSLIVATANRCGRTEIICEDLSHGQSYNGSVVRNPFPARRCAGRFQSGCGPARGPRHGRRWLGRTGSACGPL